MSIRIGCLIIIELALLNSCWAQSDPEVLWEKIIEVQGNDRASAMVSTSDGGVAICGGGGPGKSAWVVNLDGNGEMRWTTEFERSQCSNPYAIAETRDKGFVITGAITPEFENTFMDGYIRLDATVIKMDADGKVAWAKTFSGGESRYAPTYFGGTLVNSSDGGFFVCGYAGGDFQNQAWITKLDNDGKQVWEKFFAWERANYATSIIETSSKDVFVCGSFSSPEKDDDGWLLKMNQDGEILEEKTYGGAKDDRLSGIIETADGKLMLWGSTESIGKGESDIWLLTLDKNTNLLRESSYGWADTEWADSFVELKDGNFMGFGATRSKGEGEYDYWVFLTDDKGQLTQDWIFGGKNNETPRGLVETGDGSFVICGTTASHTSPGSAVQVIKFRIE